MSFDRPSLIGLALLLPGLFALAVAGYARRRRRVARSIADPGLLERIGGPGLAEFPLSRLLLVCTAAAALGLAAAGPRWGFRSIDQQSSVLDVVLAVDISKSMFAEDLTPSRLERERIFLRRFVREMGGDRLGLVVFAGRAYVLSPLTTDHGAINLYLDALDPDIVSQGGSSLAAALAQASDLARGAEEVGGDRAVVLISDGEALEETEAVRTAAERAARAGVTVFTVGVGTTSGAPVPERDAAGATIGFKRDIDGSVVVSKLDESLLQEISSMTGGRYVRLDASDAVDRLAASLRDLERRPGAGTRSETPERFAWFIAIALLLIGLDAWMHRRRGAAAAAAFGRVAVTRAAAATMILVLLGFGIGDFERGNRLYRAGHYADAVAAYEAALRDGDTRPELLYNLGTALLQLGRYDEAQRALEASLDAVEPELRQHAHYNLGNRFLRDARARQNPDEQVQLLDAAVEAYKRSLRLVPADPDAKWNLEMALRERDEAQQQQQQQDPQDSDEQEDQQPQQQPQSGTGGGGGEDSDQPQQTDRDQMSQEQADRILSAVEQDERQLTRDKLRKGERRTRVARDW